jgi:hypothetical protein
VALLFLVFLSVSFFNVAEARDVSSQENVLYLTDFECVTDITSEFDSDDHNVDITYEVSADFGVAPSTFAFQAKSSNYLNFPYLRPLTRAPPKAFI